MRRSQGSLKEIERFLPSRNYLLLISGRSALYLGLELLKLSARDEILVPGYVPEGIIKPIVRKRIKYKFYDINIDFSLNVEEIEKRISEQTKAILIIHNFGFPQNIEEFVMLCEEKNIYLIEDCAQAFLSKYNDGSPIGKYGIISIFSLTKTFSIPDGGVLVLNNLENDYREEIKMKNLEKIYIFLRDYAINAKSNLLRTVAFRLSYQLLNNFLIQPIPMSRKSLNILSKIDFSKVIRKRRNNFMRYLENIDAFTNKNIIVPFQNLPESACPFGFPILVKKRDEIYNKLRSSGVYCLKNKGWTFIDEQDSNEYPNSWKIINEILTLPVSQYISEDSIDKACSILRWWRN